MLSKPLSRPGNTQVGYHATPALIFQASTGGFAPVVIVAIRTGFAEYSQMHILIVEDDRTIGKSLQSGFREAGYSCTWAVNGKTGLERALAQQADVIVLDLMLPEMDGLLFLKLLREKGDQTPVVILTARGAVTERVAGLEAGADDYLVKPFAFAELRARIEAVARRAFVKPPPKLISGDLSLDLTNRRVHQGGREIDLTPTEFSILELLLRHAGQVVTRKMLCEHVWGFEWDGPTNVIEVHITRLRKKLDRDERSTINTVRGRGYSLVGSGPADATIR